jgi:hypothetical protein
MHIESVDPSIYYYSQSSQTFGQNLKSITTEMKHWLFILETHTKNIWKIDFCMSMGWFTIIYCFTCRSRTFHLFGDVCISMGKFEFLVRLVVLVLKVAKNWKQMKIYSTFCENQYHFFFQIYVLKWSIETFDSRKYNLLSCSFEVKHWFVCIKSVQN